MRLRSSQVAGRVYSVTSANLPLLRPLNHRLDGPAQTVRLHLFVRVVVIHTLGCMRAVLRHAGHGITRGCVEGVTDPGGAAAPDHTCNGLLIVGVIHARQG